MTPLQFVDNSMADEASESFVGAVRNYLGSLGFILPLVGVEELVRHSVDAQHPSLPIWAAVTLIVVGLPLFLLPWGWNRLWPAKPNLGETEHPESKKTEPRLQPQRLAIATALDDLYAEGVGHRNRIIPTIQSFDPDSERQTIINWSDRVLAKCDDRFVAMREKSAFRTLNLFKPQFHEAEGKSDQQKQLEAIWTEKLDRLNIIIRKIGS
jgi:hypothetical protein